MQWWAKTCQQAEDNNLEPLLFFKANHAQFFVSTKTKPAKVDYMYISMLDAYVCLAEKWLEHENRNGHMAIEFTSLGKPPTPNGNLLVVDGLNGFQVKHQKKEFFKVNISDY